MPTTMLGEFVLFYSHEGAAPSVALVTGVSSRTLNVVVYTSRGTIEKSGVHHVSDPGLAEFPGWAEYGCLDFKPDANAALVEKINALERRVADLESKRPK
jgi:hypothetical protein